MDRLTSWRPDDGARFEPVLWAVLVIVPLVIGLAWGTVFDDGDSAYAAFRTARNLALGRGWADSTSVAQAMLRSPLFVLALVPFARMGISLPRVGLVLSVLGWAAASLAITSAGKAMGRPVAALVAATLTAFSPFVVSTLGTEIPWTVALAWIAVASTLRERWAIQGFALVWMVGTHVGLSTVVLVGILLIVRFLAEIGLIHTRIPSSLQAGRRRFPVWPALILAVVLLVVLGWGLVAARQGVFLFTSPRPSWVEWGRGVQRLLGESEFYWLFLPFIGVGLLSVGRKALFAGLVWGVAAALSGSTPYLLEGHSDGTPYLLAGHSDGTAAGAMMASLGIFLAGLGVEWLIGWIKAQDLVRLDHLKLAVALVILAGLPLGTAQVASLLHRYQFRPVVRHLLEQQAADWLQAHSEPTASVLGSEMVGYLADRPTLPWDGSESDPANLANLLEPLTEHPPQYCVSIRSTGWDLLMRTVWFQDGYEPLQVFESPYDAASPVTVWGHRLRAVDLGDLHPLHVRLPGGIDWVGYEYGPDRIQPGDAVHVTLFLQASRPVTESFQTVVQLLSIQDGVAWAQRDMVTPRNVPVDWWQTGQVVGEQFVLTTTADIPVGAYHLNAFVTSPDTRDLLPMHRRDDTATLDRVTLGYVAVPWRGEMDIAKPMGANLGDQILLLGFEAPERVSPAAGFDVTLYWEAVHPPEDDYVVFVHLLDATGQLVAGHDGPPMGGQYPTGAWLPGDVIPDVHPIALNPVVPSGMYRLQVGMYRWPSLERLAVWDSEGKEMPDRVLVLQSIEVQ